MGRWPGGPALAEGWLFVAGTLVFAGSLYLLSLTGSAGSAPSPRWAAWPSCWAELAWAALRGA